MPRPVRGNDAGLNRGTGGSRPGACPSPRHPQNITSLGKRAAGGVAEREGGSVDVPGGVVATPLHRALGCSLAPLVRLGLFPALPLRSLQLFPFTSIPYTDTLYICAPGGGAKLKGGAGWVAPSLAWGKSTASPFRTPRCLIFCFVLFCFGSPLGTRPRIGDPRCPAAGPIASPRPRRAPGSRGGTGNSPGSDPASSTKLRVLPGSSPARPAVGSSLPVLGSFWGKTALIRSVSPRFYQLQLLRGGTRHPFPLETRKKVWGRTQRGGNGGTGGWRRGSWSRRGNVAQGPRLPAGKKSG